MSWAEGARLPASLTYLHLDNGSHDFSLRQVHSEAACDAERRRAHCLHSSFQKPPRVHTAAQPVPGVQIGRAHV